MRTLTRVAALLAAGTCVVTSMAACSSGSTTSGRSTDALTVNVGQPATTLDPAFGYDASSLGLLQNFYVRLTSFGAKPGPEGTTQFDPVKVTPYLAKSWVISPDGKTYTFKLTKANFSDGSPITAAAVKASLERVLAAGGTGKVILTGDQDGFYKSIEAPADDTLVLNISRPYPPLLSILASPWSSIVDSKIVAHNGGDTKGSPNKWMTTHIAGGGGPFTLESYTAGRGAVAVRNPKFFGDAPKVGKINLNFTSSDVTLALQARNGQADVTIGMSKTSATSLKGDPNLRVAAFDTDTTKRIGFVTTTAPFDNKKFRTALTYAIDYEGIRAQVNKGYGSLLFGPWATTIPDFDTSLAQPRKKDMDKAAALLKESGVKLPVTVQMAVQNDNSTDTQIATIVQNEWKPLGVNVEVVKLSAADIVASLGARRYPTFVRNNGGFVYSAIYDYADDLKCGSPSNTTNLCIKEADQLAVAAAAETDLAKRQQLLNQIVTLVNDEAPFASAYQDQAVVVLGKRVKNYFYSVVMDFMTWA
ncbi:ABC-type transport system substrate-binding protein [Amycolatopsis sulphurea]|uniref:ABC-type transport system substrate-binding protein n=1 Tax=Amycolatopsis sulphurea TaxID=76022 RepID=A0A2A9FGS2_9PSEU|nr:ABC-type transport system substrate-binding protein [Amycolatopsis sulphurea]